MENTTEENLDDIIENILEDDLLSLEESDEAIEEASEPKGKGDQKITNKIDDMDVKTGEGSEPDAVEEPEGEGPKKKLENDIEKIETKTGAEDPAAKGKPDEPKGATKGSQDDVKESSCGDYDDEEEEEEEAKSESKEIEVEVEVGDDDDDDEEEDEVKEAKKSSIEETDDEEDEEDVTESNDFIGAAAAASVEGKKEFEYNGKKYPVEMDKKKAKQILASYNKEDFDIDFSSMKKLVEEEEGLTESFKAKAALFLKPKFVLRLMKSQKSLRKNMS